MSKKFYTALGKTTTWPNIPHTSPTSLTYNDVLLLPQNSRIRSRSETDISVKFGPFKLRVPVVSAPMDTITGEKMVRKLADLGALGTLPRAPLEKNLPICRRLTKDDVPFVTAISLKDALPTAKALKKAGVKMILVDVANGGLKVVQAAAAAIKKQLRIDCFTGNIASFEHAKRFKHLGLNLARVGIGPGGLCTTRQKTGIGIPQLSAILETTSAGIEVCADGGIRQPADVAKALAAGASSVMIGSLFAGTEETPGKIQDGYKLARGQASTSYMNHHKITMEDHRTDEGIATMVKAQGSVEHIIKDIVGGLKSSMSYTNAKTIKEFQRRAVFLVANTPSAQLEARPHILET